MIDYNTLLLWLSFTLCLSMTAGGILVLFRHRQGVRKAAFNFLQYFLILLYVFGFYGLWSGILVAELTNLENVEAVATLVSRLGAPFYLCALVMLLIWVARAQERPAGWIVALTSTLTIALVMIISLVGVLLAQPWGGDDPVRTVCSVAGLVTSLAVVATLVSGSKAVVRPEARNALTALAAGTGLIHLGAFTPLVQEAHYETIFVVLFYLFNTALVVFYTYQAVDDEVQPQPRLTLDDFLARYGISKREADIVHGIYAGKTNQEIANQLFITLQTVKDHSSRIYQKAFVKNRAQLTTLIRETQNVS
ncbi:MAG: LuxR C-terminal-related transcriptional regulator [Gammaproteobacteria bacterium]|nr:LuxR C-terminal-related transcriptional regulator [Gammaproteobacteria bacterium]